jgi:cytosine deaminase
MKNSSYWLKNAHIPQSLLSAEGNFTITSDQLLKTNLLIHDGKVREIQPHYHTDFHNLPVIDLENNIVLPCLIDVHTHLDKGHIWQRCPNTNGTFQNALNAVFSDQRRWNAKDLYRRMDFGLKCSYAHGTKALRTHLDCPPELLPITLAVWQELRPKWQDRVVLQAVSLVTLDCYVGDYGEHLADQIAEIGGILGGVAYMNPQLELQLDRLFQLAKDRNLAVDLHTDENGDRTSETLRYTAEAVIRNQFTLPVTCGHCCSLSVQSDARAWQTMELVKQTKINIVSLPLCNLYLQDRQYASAGKSPITPQWRGITRVHELQQLGVPVALASDNCRDPFYAFGDHDLLQVFTQSVQIGHLDTDYNAWIRSINQVPAQIMNLPNAGVIRVGMTADLIIFNARYYSELLSRPQSDRRIMRCGQFIDAVLPSYRELDDLLMPDAQSTHQTKAEAD